MAAFKVLLTDYAWADLEIERTVLAEVDAELIVAEQQDEPTLCRLATDVDAILTCWANVTAAVIAAAPKCKIVSRLGIGLDNIDVECCTRRGIPVTNVPDYCTREVAEHTLALILSLARHTALFHHVTKLGRYELQAVPAPRRLQQQTLGIVGCGNIGRLVARMAKAIGMRVITYTRTPTDEAQNVNLQTLLQESDFVSLHAPLTDETRHLMGSGSFALMKPTAYLINTSRGGLVDHDALAAALERGELAGAALDVQTPEPPDLDSPPYNHRRVIVTPHAAFVSVESVAELRHRATQHVAQVLQGDVPNNVVNRESLA